MAFTNPEALDLAPWTNIGSPVVTADDTTAPDGTLTAEKLAIDSAGGNSTCCRFQVQTLTSDDPYTCSIFAKADQVDFLSIAEGSFDTSGGHSYFDLTNGTVTTKSVNHDDAGIEYYGDGWYRCWIVYTTTTDVIGNFRFYTADSDGGITLTRDGTSSIHMWGAVVEQTTSPSTYTSVGGTTLSPAAGRDPLIAGVTKEVTGGITRGVTESWSNR